MNYYTHRALANGIEESFFNGIDAPETVPPCERLQASYATLVNLYAQVGICRAERAGDTQAAKRAHSRKHRNIGWITLGHHHHTSVAYEVGRCCAALLRLMGRTELDTVERILTAARDLTSLLKRSKGIDGTLENVTVLAAMWIQAELSTMGVDPAEYLPSKDTDLTYGDPSMPLRFDLPVL